MSQYFRVKNKLSSSSKEPKEGVFKVRARIVKKLSHFHPLEIQERIAHIQRYSSLSPHKIKSKGSNMFREAHKIDSKQTFLTNEKIGKLSKTNQSHSPVSPYPTKNKVVGVVPCSANLRSLSSSVDHEKSVKKGSKDIQRTVSITIQGKKKNFPNQKKLMTTLSRLILGDTRSEEDYYLEIMGESSIHGDEENFIDLGSHQFSEDEQPLNDDVKG